MLILGFFGALGFAGAFSAFGAAALGLADAFLAGAALATTGATVGSGPNFTSGGSGTYGIGVVATGTLSAGLLLVTTNGIGVVAAGSGTLYGADTLGVVTASNGCLSLVDCNPNNFFKKSNINVSFTSIYYRVRILYFFL
jgi:hypothetical protein